MVRILKESTQRTPKKEASIHLGYTIDAIKESVSKAYSILGSLERLDKYASFLLKLQGVDALPEQSQKTLKILRDLSGEILNDSHKLNLVDTMRKLDELKVSIDD